MKIINTIINWILLIANNKNWLKALLVMVIGTGCFVVGAIAFSKTKKEDCTYYKEQNNQLIDAFKQIRNELSPQPTSFIETEIPIIFASYIDTIPSKYKQATFKFDTIIDYFGSPNFTYHPMDQWFYNQFVDTIPKKKPNEQINRVLSKIDSILNKYKTDTLKNKTKNI